jgi:hypothetical protein
VCVCVCGGGVVQFTVAVWVQFASARNLLARKHESRCQ